MNQTHGPLNRFERNIAGKAICHYDIGLAGKKVVTFNKTNVIQCACV